MIGACACRGAPEGPGYSLGLVPVLRASFGEVREEGDFFFCPFIYLFVHSFILSHLGSFALPLRSGALASVPASGVRLHRRPFGARGQDTRCWRPLWLWRLAMTTSGGNRPKPAGAKVGGAARWWPADAAPEGLRGRAAGSPRAEVGKSPARKRAASAGLPPLSRTQASAGAGWGGDSGFCNLLTFVKSAPYQPPPPLNKNALNE